MRSIHKLVLTLAAILAVSTASFAQTHPSPNRPKPNRRSEARREVRAYERGYQDGYRNGLDARGGTGAPDWMINGLFGDERTQFKRGYKDGFNKGKKDRRSNVRPRRS